MFRFATPYNLAKHLNKDFYINFQSQKWSERKDAIQELINIMEKNPVLVPNEQELQKLINDLSKVLYFFHIVYFKYGVLVVE